MEGELEEQLGEGVEAENKVGLMDNQLERN